MTSRRTRYSSVDGRNALIVLAYDPDRPRAQQIKDLARDFGLTTVSIRKILNQAGYHKKQASAEKQLSGIRHQASAKGLKAEDRRLQTADCFETGLDAGLPSLPPRLRGSQGLGRTLLRAQRLGLLLEEDPLPCWLAEQEWLELLWRLPEGEE